jgi:hypothetical protein
MQSWHAELVLKDRGYWRKGEKEVKVKREEKNEKGMNEVRKEWNKERTESRRK